MVPPLPIRVTTMLMNIIMTGLIGIGPIPAIVMSAGNPGMSLNPGMSMAAGLRLPGLLKPKNVNPRWVIDVFTQPISL